ncbi:MAG: ASPIC/UnbV domain-containing protein [Pirellulaceae bacterium]|nr:ASPIC/UnbV domain-containing protein [Pirellulaceae bacterium]
MWLAVVSQPFDCSTSVPELREADKDNGEFWVGNPFQFSFTKENLSAFERNGVFFNTGNRDFLDMSFISGGDNRGDSRTVIGTDINQDGMPDLLIRQVGGGALVVYQNNFPKTNWLVISLRGEQSNSAGIGAKIAVTRGDLTVRRELIPIVNFLSQTPSRVHIGMSDSEVAKEITIQWPAGGTTILKNVQANQHIRVYEKDGHIEKLY